MPNVMTPSEYRWHPLFNTAKFGWRPLLECRAVTLPRREARWNLLRCPELANRSQPLVWAEEFTTFRGHVEMYVSFWQWSSLLWTHTLRPFYNMPIALTQEGGIWLMMCANVCETEGWGGVSRHEQRPLTDQKKDIKSIIYNHISTTRCKFDENQSSRSWDNWSPRNHF